MKMIVAILTIGLALPGRLHASQPVELPDTLAEAISLLRAQVPAKEALQEIGSGWVLVPTAANAPGKLGAYFKTRVSVYGQPEFTSSTGIPMKIYALTPTGRLSVTYTLPAGNVKTWENALQEIFGYSGAAAILFETDNVDDSLFVTAEVYTDSPNGRFSTAVDAQTILDFVGSTYPDLTIGVSAGGSFRANIGCSSYSGTTSTTTATLYGADGYKVKAFTFAIPAYGWNQIAVDVPVSRGAILWQNPSAFAFCWAVNVDNTSNDGTFIGRTTYVP